MIRAEIVPGDPDDMLFRFLVAEPSHPFELLAMDEGFPSKPNLPIALKAFDATMKDPEFIAEAQKENLDLTPQNGVYLDSLIAGAHATPKSIIDKIADLAK